MSLVHRIHESGVLVAEQRCGDAALRHALKQVDDRLRLLPPDVVYPGTSTGYWRVVRQWSDDHPAEPVLTWVDDDGKPLPLTTGLVDAVQRLRTDSRNKGATVDEQNDRHVAEVQTERNAVREAIDEEYGPYLERGRVGVSMATMKRRPYWQRKSRGGYVE